MTATGISTSGEQRAQVVRHDLAAGRWIRATRAPDRRLAPLLTRPYLGFVQEAARFERWLEPPQPALTLMVSLGEPFRERGATLPQAWVAGLENACTVVESAPRYACLDLKIAPLGAYTLVGRPLRELAGRVVGLEELFGPAGRELSERVLDARGWNARFDLVEGFLARRATEGPEVSPAAAYAWARLRETDGRVSVGQLAAELRCSRRHLVATFNEQVGLPPKTVARLLRFERVRRRLAADPVRLAEIAADCGYCDQAHLNRDFRDLAGTTPTEFLARQVAVGSASGEGVTFVQDGSGATA